MVYQSIEKRSADTRNKIKNQEPLAAPDLFEHRTKHEQSIHIKKEMPETAMHEHVGDILIEMKIT